MAPTEDTLTGGIGQKNLWRTGPRTQRQRAALRSQRMSDADVEAFCRLYARVILRLNGLAGRPRGARVDEEVNHESA